MSSALTDQQVLMYFQTNIKAFGLPPESEASSELQRLITEENFRRLLPTSSTAIDVENYRHYQAEIRRWLSLSSPLRTAVVRLLPRRMVKVYELMVDIKPSFLTFRNHEYVYFGLTMDVSPDIAKKNNFGDLNEMVKFRASIRQFFEHVQEIFQILIAEEGDRPGTFTIPTALSRSGRDENDFTELEIWVATKVREALGMPDVRVTSALYVPVEKDDCAGAVSGYLPEGGGISLPLIEQDADKSNDPNEGTQEEQVTISEISRSKDGQVRLRSEPEEKRFAADCASGLDVVLDYLGRIGVEIIVLMQETQRIRSGVEKKERILKSIAEIPEQSLLVLQQQQKKIAALDFATSQSAIGSLFEMFGLMLPEELENIEL